MRSTVLILAAIVIAVARLYVSPHPLSLVGSYQAAAHLFVGVLAVLAWQGDMVSVRLFWGLCVVEVAMATISRM